jgi:hypothetical protein
VDHTHAYTDKFNVFEADGVTHATKRRCACGDIISADVQADPEAADHDLALARDKAAQAEGYSDFADANAKTSGAATARYESNPEVAKARATLNQKARPEEFPTSGYDRSRPQFGSPSPTPETQTDNFNIPDFAPTEEPLTPA